MLPEKKRLIEKGIAVEADCVNAVYESLRPGPPKTIPGTPDISNYEVVGYLCGDKIDTRHELTFDHFDWVQLIKYSENPKNKQLFTHFLCYRNKVPTVVVGKFNGIYGKTNG